MPTPVVVDAGELSMDELIGALHYGTRIVVNTSVFGTQKQVTLRFDGETYYCDTPTRLHKHTTEAEMRTCILKHGYTSDEPDSR